MNRKQRRALAKKRRSERRKHQVPVETVVISEEEQRQFLGARIFQDILDCDSKDFPMFKRVIESCVELEDSICYGDVVDEVGEETFNELLYKSAIDKEVLTKLESVFSNTAKMNSECLEKFYKTEDEEVADEEYDKSKALVDNYFLDSMRELCVEVSQ